jgi:asparagine synthetase B (glutamine-hydrolysing)
MCGIFGFVGSAPNLERLKEVAVLASSRGVHSWGIEWQSGSKKGSGKLEDNLGVLALTEDSPVVLGHCRLATIGAYNGVIQPLNTEHLSVAHNGNIYNYKQLAQKIGYSLKTDCDSEIIGALMERGATLQDVSDTIQTNHAILVRQGTKLKAVHRGLPLFVGKFPEGIYYCSRKFRGSVPLREGVMYS